MQGITSVLWGIHQYCGGIALVLWEKTAVHVRDNVSTVGIPSVLWRLFSTVGVTEVYVKENISTVGIPSVLLKLFSTVGYTFSTVEDIWHIGVYLQYMQGDNISTVGDNISSVEGI